MNSFLVLSLIILANGVMAFIFRFADDTIKIDLEKYPVRTPKISDLSEEKAADEYYVQKYIDTVISPISRFSSDIFLIRDTSSADDFGYVIAYFCAFILSYVRVFAEIISPIKEDFWFIALVIIIICSIALFFLVSWIASLLYKKSTYKLPGDGEFDSRIISYDKFEPDTNFGTSKEVSYSNYIYERAMNYFYCYKQTIVFRQSVTKVLYKVSGVLLFAVIIIPRLFERGIK